MFGGRKRHNAKEAEQNQAQKKQWQLEIEDEMDEGIPEDLEIPKDLSDDENNQENENEQIANENNKEEENVEENKQKEFDWMTSEDEMENGKEPEDDEQLTKAKPENAEEEENPDAEIVENDDSKDARTIFISNIPLDATDEQILDKFRIFGTIMNIEVPRNEGSRLNKGRAFIEFNSIEEAQEVFEGKHYLKDNLLNITLGLNKAINTVTAAPKELPFTYDERTRKYLKAGEIEMRKKREEEEGSEESSDSSSESGSESGSGSGSDSGESDSDDEQLIKRKKPVDVSDDEGDFKKQSKGRRRKDSRSRSRSHDKSPTRTISTKKR